MATDSTDANCSNALDHLYQVKIYEQQQAKASKHVLQQTMDYEEILLKRRTENERQSDIRSLLDDYKAYSYGSFQYIYNLAGDFDQE